VLVIAARGITHCALLGGNLARGLQQRGVAGVVVDGAIRDAEQMQGNGFAVHARGLALCAGPKPEPGEINVPVSFGGCVIFPGDIVVADEDGIAVVPAAHAEAVLGRVAKLQEGHARSRASLERGEYAGIGPIRQALVDSDCEFIQGAWGG
jgi:regulator of RNase E activity RraA